MKKIHESKNSKKFNATINKVHEEIENAKNKVCDWNVRWKEIYSDVYCYDLQFLGKDIIDLLQSKYDYMYDLSRYWDDSKRSGQAIEKIKLEDYVGEEYICEFRKLDWLIYNNKIGRVFSFANDGRISYAQTKRKRVDEDKSYDYFAEYNVNNNEITLRFINNNEEFCFMNSTTRQYSFEDKFIVEKEDSITIIEKKSDTQQLEIVLDKAGRVLKKFLTDGDYYFVIEGNDFVLASNGEDVFDIDEHVILQVQSLMSDYEIGTLSNDDLFVLINRIKIKVINAIKGIKGDVPLVGLAKRLDIALSMISTKRQNSIEENKKGLKKKK